jgi:hypothetical protein
MPAPVHQKSFTLTVSESKRLIARAISRHPAITRALNQGFVAVTKGTTNSYLVEELTGEGIHRPHYCTGVTKPARGAEWAQTANKLPDLVLRNGVREEGVSAVEAVPDMGPADVFVKGANAINYDLGQAGILIGHPTGGTIGAAIGAVVSRRINLLIPVGLEKNIPGDLDELYRDLASVGADGSGPMLWPIPGEIFTEIEAIRLVSGARAALIGAGGIAGAEGGVRLSVWGAPDQVDRASAAIEDILGEPPFLTP